MSITRLYFTEYQLKKLAEGKTKWRFIIGKEIVYVENTKYFNLITMKWE
jgi:hypothetical protein